MPEEPARIFLDASVLVAAAGSPSGGSALVLAACRARRFVAVASQRVLREAELNIRRKLPPESLVRFYRELASLDPQIVEPASEEETRRYAHLVAEKDAHVLAAAVESRAQFLLTLDRRHLLTETVASAGLPCAVLTPGEFLAWVREQHRGDASP